MIYKIQLQRNVNLNGRRKGREGKKVLYVRFTLCIFELLKFCSDSVCGKINCARGTDVAGVTSVEVVGRAGILGSKLLWLRITSRYGG